MIGCYVQACSTLLNRVQVCSPCSGLFSCACYVQACQACGLIFTLAFSNRKKNRLQ